MLPTLIVQGISIPWRISIHAWQHTVAISTSILVFSSATYATELSLADVLKKVRAQNIEFQASKDQLIVQENQVQMAQAKFLPKIDLEGRYTHLNDSIDLDLNPVRQAIIGSGQTAATVSAGAAAGSTTAASLNQSLPPFKINIQEQNYFNAALTLSQPLYAGGKIAANYEVKHREWDVARLESMDTLEKVLLSTAQAYFNVRLAELNLQVRSDMIRGLRAHQQIGNKLLTEGQITKIAKMNADLKVKEAEAAEVKAHYEHELTRKILSNLINEDIGSTKLTTNLLVRAESGEVKDFRERARKGNTAVKIAEMRAGMLNFKHKAVFADYLPTVFAFGRYELYRENLTALEPEWVVGIGLRMNIYSGGETRDSVAAVVAEQTVVQKQIEAAVHNLEIGIEKAFLDMVSSREQLEFLDAAVRVAEERVQLTNAAFRSGGARSVDVTDAYNAQEQTRLARLKCLSDYNFAYFQLKRLTGEVDEKMGELP